MAAPFSVVELSQPTPEPDLSHDLLREKCFWVRGWTWFRRATGYSVSTQLGPYVDGVRDPQTGEIVTRGMPQLLDARPEWKRELGRLERFSHRQVVNGASEKKREALQFEKAVLSLLTAEAAAEAWAKKTNAPSAQDPFPGEFIYDHMRIEAACFYIGGFNRKTIEALLAKDPMLMNKLCEYTGNPDPQVFYDMADAKVVTEQLARNVHSFLIEHAPELPIGIVSAVRNSSIVYKSSVVENLDAPISVNGGGVKAAEPRYTARRTA